ncbi:conserved protein of unknown function (plasmid) [Streptantibioticus cattleyicolor NRRL 8057 = DSM 46488]|nr:conserved protein of unknown function [Streptantibioticus cattleyicolor NRRL 8057 = DSM 46488]
MARHISSVDLPAPGSPRTTTASPGRIASEAPSSATYGPKDLRTPNAASTTLGGRDGGEPAWHSLVLTCIGRPTGTGRDGRGTGADHGGTACRRLYTSGIRVMYTAG